MAYKISRIFCNNYVPDYTKLRERFYTIVNRNKSIIIVNSPSKGFGMFSGKTKKRTDNFPFKTVSIFVQDSKELLWTVISDENGNYTFKNLNIELQYFLIAFDDQNVFNAVIKDKIKPQDGRINNESN